MILHNTQEFIQKKLGGADKKPVKFVFHGGSGSSVTPFFFITLQPRVE